MRWVYAVMHLCWVWPIRPPPSAKQSACREPWKMARLDCHWGPLRTLVLEGFKMSSRVWGGNGSPLVCNGKKNNVYAESQPTGISICEAFFPVCLPRFFSTHFIVFIGCTVDDAAALEKDWCDFYRRIVNMGHKTRLLYFPQPKEKCSLPFTIPVKAEAVCGKPLTYKKQRCELPHSSRRSHFGLRKTRRPVVCDVMSQSEYSCDVFPSFFKSF